MCDDGFEFADNITDILCTENGTWTKMPECKKRTCGIFIAPDNAILLNSSSVEYFYGESVYLECMDMFYIVGEHEVRCQSDGNWSSAPYCNMITCPKLAIANASLEFLTPTTVSVECDEHYVLEGLSAIYCSQNETWSSVPKCTRRTCKNLPATDNLIADNNDTETVTVISVSCAKGYSIQGNNFVTCFINSSWSPIPTCDIVDCGRFSNGDGRFNIEEGETVFNTTLLATCLPGMSLKDGADVSIYCNASGIWDGYPECEIQGKFMYIYCVYRYHKD